MRLLQPGFSRLAYKRTRNKKRKRAKRVVYIKGKKMKRELLKAV